MLNIRKLALITATQCPLQDLCLAGKLTSPFYNVFTVVALKEFTQDEAREFMRAYHQRVSFKPDELEFILDRLLFHPLKLQILCDWVIQNRTHRLSKNALEEKIAEEYKNFFVGKFDLRKLQKWKGMLDPDKIKKWLDLF